MSMICTSVNLTFYRKLIRDAVGSLGWIVNVIGMIG